MELCRFLKQVLASLLLLQVTTQGVLANEWAIRGLQPNQYYATADELEIPLQLDQDPNDYITFHPDTYKPGRVPPSVFKLPGGGFDCSKNCPLASVCTIAALRGRVQGLFGGRTSNQHLQQRQQPQQSSQRLMEV